MTTLDPRLPLVQNADLDGKVVLVRFDHNVVKKGVVKDPYRIDRTIGTLYSIVERGGRPILMTHIGRPRDKKTGAIRCDAARRASSRSSPTSSRSCTRASSCRSCPADGDRGILGIDTSINLAVRELRARRFGGHLPAEHPLVRRRGGRRARRAPRSPASSPGLADVFVNDAFGSWQPHCSTVDVTRHLPSFAGYLMQEEIANLGRVLEPERPFVAVVAGRQVRHQDRPAARDLQEGRPPDPRRRDVQRLPRGQVRRRDRRRGPGRRRGRPPARRDGQDGAQGRRAALRRGVRPARPARRRRASARGRSPTSSRASACATCSTSTRSRSATRRWPRRSGRRRRSSSTR